VCHESSLWPQLVAEVGLLALVSLRFTIKMKRCILCRYTESLWQIRASSKLFAYVSCTILITQSLAESRVVVVVRLRQGVGRIPPDRFHIG